MNANECQMLSQRPGHAHIFVAILDTGEVVEANCVDS